MEPVQCIVKVRGKRNVCLLMEYMDEGSKFIPVVYSVLFVFSRHRYFMISLHANIIIQ